MHIFIYVCFILAKFKANMSLWEHINGERIPDPRGLGVVVFEEMKKHDNMVAQVIYVCF